MSNRKTKYLVFREDFDHRARELKTKVILVGVSATPPNRVVEVNAIWDTGATHSVITPWASDFLKLFPVDMVPIIGVNHERPETRPVSIIHVELSNSVLLQTRRVSVTEIGDGADMLIGMDIIELFGNFSFRTNSF